MIDDNALTSLERLHKLKTDGVITEDDFEKAKQDLLQGKRKPQPQPAFAARKADGELPADGDFFAWMTPPLTR